MKKAQENYLDYVPRHNKLFPYQKKENGRIEVKVVNTGLMRRITQLLLRKPKYSYIELDDFGSFIWEQIDGKRTVYTIGELVKERFGEEAEPLYERLSTFIKILHNNRYIVYQNKIDQVNKAEH